MKNTFIFLLLLLFCSNCTINSQLIGIRSDLNYLMKNSSTKADFSKLDSLYRVFSTTLIDEKQKDILLNSDTLSKNDLKRIFARPIKDK